ncbi:MAG TPA: ABC transporter substrate-binding protein [Syntrophorhabdales bacterium]|nr:ABC transporter substrate-binding protein [Syntrophorhabdales bacterium]
MKKYGVMGLVGLVVVAIALLGASSSVMGAPAKEIIIGNLQDLSGPTSVWGNAVTRGAELAAEKINAQGGINGAKIKMISLDTKGDVQEAIKAFNRLVDQDKAVAVIGPPISNIGIGLAPIADAKKVAFVGSFADPRATVGEDGKVHPSMFLIQPTTVQYGEIMASYTVEKLGLKKIAILYDQSNAYAVSLVAPFKAYAESVGAKIVDEEVYGKTDRDYRTQLSKIKSSGADCVFAPNYIQGLVITAKQAKQLGLTMPFVGALDYAAPFASLVNDPEAANNIYFANNYSDSEPQLTAVRSAYKAKYNEDPINKVYLGYDKMLVVVEGIKKGGGATPDKIIEGLNKVSGLQGTTGVITISPKTHQPVGLSMVMYHLDHGVYKDLGRYVPAKHKQQQ